MPEPDLPFGAKPLTRRDSNAAQFGRSSTITGLFLEIRTHNRKIIFGKATNNFFLKIIATCCCGCSVTLLKRRTALVDVFLQAIVQVFIAAAFCDFRLIVELDFIHQQAGKALRLAVRVGIFGRQSSERICGRSGRRGCRTRRRCMRYFDNLYRFRLRSWFRRGVFRCMRREWIGKCTDSLNGRGDRDTFDRWRDIAGIFLHLLAQGGHFKPRTSRHYQHFQGGGVEYSIGSAIGIQ